MQVYPAKPFSILYFSVLSYNSLMEIMKSGAFVEVKLSGGALSALQSSLQYNNDHRKVCNPQHNLKNSIDL